MLDFISIQKVICFINILHQNLVLCLAKNNNKKQISLNYEKINILFPFPCHCFKKKVLSFDWRKLQRVYEYSRNVNISVMMQGATKNKKRIKDSKGNSHPTIVITSSIIGLCKTATQRHKVQSLCRYKALLMFSTERMFYSKINLFIQMLNFSKILLQLTNQ